MNQRLSIHPSNSAPRQDRQSVGLDVHEDAERSGLRQKSDALDRSLRRARESSHLPQFPHAIGSYLLSDPIASGGMATVHIGVGRDDSRLLAIKRLHPHLMGDEYFLTMLLDEARIAARVRHPNVVATYGADLVDDNLVLVMEYVRGAPLSVITQTQLSGALPPR